jgi:hypothetical protein
MSLKHAGYGPGKPRVGLVSRLVPKGQSLRLCEKSGNRRLELLAVLEQADVAPVVLVQPFSSPARFAK